MCLPPLKVGPQAGLGRSVLFYSISGITVKRAISLVSSTAPGLLTQQLGQLAGRPHQFQLRFLSVEIRLEEVQPLLAFVQPRLFDRRAARWSDDPVHEKVLYAVTPGRLEGDLLHDSADDLGRYMEKQNRYTTLAAPRPGTKSPTVAAVGYYEIGSIMRQRYATLLQSNPL